MADDVIIIGAGPTGLLAAIALARRGVRVRMLEKRPEPVQTSRALGVFARTLELYDRLRLADEMISRGRTLHGVMLHADGKELAALSADGLDSPFHFILSIPQAVTEQVLGEAAIRAGAVIERGVELIEVGQSPDDVCAVALNHEGRRARYRARWLIACDGAHSMVRRRLGLRFEGENIDRWFMFADATADAAWSPDHLNLYLAPDGVAGAIPLPGGPEEPTWRLIVSLPPGERAPDDPSLEQVVAYFEQRSGITVRARDATWLTTFTIRQRVIERMRAGRVFFVGDAAHTHSPAGGQGMNTGLQDAENLAWKLALVVQGKASAALLTTYEEERLPVAESIVRGTGALTKLVTLRGSLSQAIRNRMMRFALHFDAVERQAVRTLSELNADYRGASMSADRWPSAVEELLHFHRDALVSAEDVRHGPHAGDRAPDAIVVVDGAEQRVFELGRGGKFMLLMFEGEHGRESFDCNAMMAEVEQALPLEVCTSFIPWSDANVESHRRYGAAHPTLILIRPDGAIAMRSQPADVMHVQEWIKLLGARPQV